MSKTFVVFASTGKQGAGFVEGLSKAEADKPGTHRILAVTRDPTSDKSKAIGSLPGVQLVQGEATDAAALFAAHNPVHGVFLVLPPGYAKEKEEGIATVEAAAKAGVKHFIYSSNDFAGFEDKGLPRFDAKRSIEKRVEALFPSSYTILRPVIFFENLLWDVYRSNIPVTFNPSIRMKFIAGLDIGRIGAECAKRPEEFMGKIVEMAGDAYTPPQLESLWKEITKTEMRIDPTPAFAPSVQGLIDDVCNKHEFLGDPEATRRAFPFVQDLKSWLAESPLAAKA